MKYIVLTFLLLAFSIQDIFAITYTACKLDGTNCYYSIEPLNKVHSDKRLYFYYLDKKTGQKKLVVLDSPYQLIPERKLINNDIGK